MTRLIQPLLFLFARCTKNELIRQLEFLKAENEILRSRIPQKRIVLQPAERRRLIELGRDLGTALREVLTIVAYNTFRRWLRDPEVASVNKKTAGRPRTAVDIQELVLRIRSETGWGYTRILGELKKLGITPPSRSTVKNILREHGFDPRPERHHESWANFLTRHADTLWQCDFFSKRIWTWTGPRQFFALVFLHVTTRMVLVTPCSRKPDAAWIREQTGRFVSHAKESGIEPGLVIRDGDNMFANGFDDVLAESGFNVHRLTFRSPNLNAYIERWVQSIQQECLDHFLVFGEKHFDFLIGEYVEHYHTERPHQSLGNVPLVPGSIPDKPTREGPIVCQSRLGGWLKHYERRAA